VAFAALMALLASVGFGLAPALASAGGDVQALPADGTKSPPAGARGAFLRALVVGETAVAMVILVGAGLCSTPSSPAAVDPGPDPDRTVTLQVFLSDPAQAEAKRSHAVFTTLVERAAAMPGVGLRPASSSGRSTGLRASTTRSASRRDRQEQAAYPSSTTRRSPRTISGPPDLAGARARLACTDGAEAPRVVIIGEAVARRFWPGQDPVGKRMKWGGTDSPAPWLEVVGVVEDSRYRGLETVTLDAYVPYEQSPWPLNHLVLRTRSDPAAVAAELRREVAALVPSARLLDVATVGAMMRNARAPLHDPPGLVRGGGARLGIGLAGVLWFTTRERTRDRDPHAGASAGRIRLEVLEGWRWRSWGWGSGCRARCWPIAPEPALRGRLITPTYAVGGRAGLGGAGGLLPPGGPAARMPPWRSGTNSPPRAGRTSAGSAHGPPAGR
jgi:putative ABC transport system permease protein